MSNMRMMAPTEASTSAAIGERNWVFQVLRVGGIAKSSLESSAVAFLIGEAAVSVVGDAAKGFLGDDGSISIGGTPGAVGVLGDGPATEALVGASTVEDLDRE